MIPARYHRAFGAWHGWWATAARMLALVLALALVAPTAGYAEDAAFHAEQSTVSVGTNGHADSDADPCVALHLNCCPHQAIAVTADVGEPVQAVERTVYRTLDVAVATVFAERLPKPPRA